MRVNAIHAASNSSIASSVHQGMRVNNTTGPTAASVIAIKNPSLPGMADCRRLAGAEWHAIAYSGSAGGVADLPVKAACEARAYYGAAAGVSEGLALLVRQHKLRKQIEEILGHRLVGKGVLRILIETSKPVRV
jgi:hypothetical protein